MQITLASDFGLNLFNCLLTEMKPTLIENEEKLGHFPLGLGLKSHCPIIFGTQDNEVNWVVKHCCVCNDAICCQLTKINEIS